MRTHHIKRGDTLSALARRYGTTVGQLAKANNISNPDLIFAGRTLKISGGGSTESSGGARRSGASRRTSAPAPTAAPPSSSRSGRGSSSARASRAPANDSYDAGRSSRSSTAGGISHSELRRIMPSLSSDKARQYLPHLNRAMQEAGITGKKRQAAFLAQLGHESGGLRYMEEIASGAAYEGRRDLGNTRPGDGRRYKGRGPIQLTGRANYRSAGRALGLNLEANPEQAARPNVAFRIAAWFWKSRGLNALADSGAFREITRRINGGFNGLMDRFRYWARAKAAL